MKQKPTETRHWPYPGSLAEYQRIAASEPTPQLWRALARVLSVELGSVTVLIPGWGSEPVRLELTMFPETMRPLLVPGFRFHLRANLAAETTAELAVEIMTSQKES
jgi:hypothetical protein